MPSHRNQHWSAITQLNHSLRFTIYIVLPTSSTPASRPYQSNISFPDSREGSSRPNRVRSPSYRTELERHGVYIDSYGMTTPDAVQIYAKNITGRKRLSPALSGQELESTRKQLAGIASKDEGTTKAGLSKTSLFPSEADYNDRFAAGSKEPFDRAGLPYVSGYNYPSIVTPAPDLHYGYPGSSLDDHEYATMQHSRFKPYSQPNSANFWPFFAVEFKSQSRGGTSWVAENQNAGIGSHSVNSMEILMKYARGQKQRQITDSLFFSCTDIQLWCWQCRRSKCQWMWQALAFFERYGGRNLCHQLCVETV